MSPGSKTAADLAAMKSRQDLEDRLGELQQLFVEESVFFVPDWPTMLPGGQDILQTPAP